MLTTTGPCGSCITNYINNGLLEYRVKVSIANNLQPKNMMHLDPPKTVKSDDKSL